MARIIFNSAEANIKQTVEDINKDLILGHTFIEVDALTDKDGVYQTIVVNLNQVCMILPSNTIDQ